MNASAPSAGADWRAPAALVVNAFVWGVSWWPFRELQAQGLHPLWATTLVYGVITAGILLWRPAAGRDLLRPSPLWVLVVAAGTTNATFNWAVSIGDVVRVVLLFYLMPLWAVILARLLLGERLSGAAALRVALGLAGAVIVLWPAEGWAAHLGAGGPGLADALAVLGGFTFALNNVMLRREQARPEASRAAAMFGGGVVVAGGLAAVLTAQGAVPAVPALAPAWAGAALLLGLAFLGGNLALQYGAARLPAHRTAVLMLTEIVFATASAVALGAGVIDARAALGGALILGSALLAAREGSG